MSVRMRRCRFQVVAAGIFVLAGASVGMAQSNDPMYGVWKLNVAKSSFSPGPTPKEATLTIEAAGPGRKVSVEGVNGDGTPLKWGYTGTFDGKDIKVTGTNPDADVVVLRRLSKTTTRTTYKKAGTRTIVNVVEVAADGKTLTVAGSGVNAKGQTVKNSQVFEKQ